MAVNQSPLKEESRSSENRNKIALKVDHQQFSGKTINLVADIETMWM